MKNRWHGRIMWAIGLVVPGLLFHSSRAATLVVDARGGTPYQTIQAAINAAIPGMDNVFVRCGFYFENIQMRSLVSVTGEGASCSVIDGQALDSAVTMVDIAPGTIFGGFTVRNGRAALGGGIYIENGSPTIEKNVIVGNHALNDGGGIHITSPAGFSEIFTTAPIITANIIRDNRADRFGGGIEIYSDDGSTIANNLIVENTAEQGGGGIDAYQSFPTIVHNTIARNCRQGMGTACAQGGGGISLVLSGIVKLVNNLIVFNEAAIGGGGVDTATSTATFNANDTFGNLPSNYAGVANPTGSNGNLSADPLLIDERKSRLGYHPRSDSPLIDAGSTLNPQPLDLRGIPRPLDGDANGTARPDIGARENEGVSRLRFDSTTALQWDPSTVPASYHLYRGDLQVLRTTGTYTQDPATVPGARRQCNLPSPSATDSDNPPTSAPFFYLVTLKNAVEGTLGFRSNLSERPFTAMNRCP